MGLDSKSPRSSFRSRSPSDPASPADRLVTAAETLFAQFGYDAVSTGQVAVAAGLTQSMVHYHFGNKEQLWKAVIDRIMRKRGRSFPVNHLSLQDVDPLSRLKVIVRNFVMSNASDPNLTRILIHEGVRHTPRLTWLAKQYMLPGYDMWNKAIEEAIEAKQIKPLPVHDVTNIIIGACALTYSLESLLTEMYGPDSPKRSTETLCETLITVLFDGLKA